MTNILVLGASGRTGQMVTDNALSRGFQVTALVRDPSKVTPREGLKVVQGTPQNLDDVQRAMQGVNAVVVALNNNRTSDMPWSKQVSPPTLIADSVSNAVQAMKYEGVSRIVIMSAYGVGDSKPEAPWMMRWLIDHTNLGKTYADHEIVDSFIRDSGVDWTLARPVMLTDDDTVTRVQASHVGDGVKVGTKVSRANVADFMINAIDDTTTIGQAVTLANAK